MWTPKGRESFSVFHECDETFSLMDVMMWYLITRQTAGSVLNLWPPFILHAFRARQREAVLQKHGRSTLHGLNCPWHTACKWGKSNWTSVLPFLPILVTHVGIRTFSERRGIREKETQWKILNPSFLMAIFSLYFNPETYLPNSPDVGLWQCKGSKWHLIIYPNWLGKMWFIHIIKL